MAKADSQLMVGRLVSGQKLKNLYDGHAVNVLIERHFLKESSPRKKGQRPSFKILAPLPVRHEYQELRDEEYRTTVAAVIEKAMIEAEALQEEMQEWYDSLPDSFQQSDRGETISQTASALESIAFSDLPEICKHLYLVHLPSLRSATTRAARAYEVERDLEAAMKVVECWEQMMRPYGSPPGKSSFTIQIDDEKIKVDWSEIAYFLSEADNARHELESCEFPGMYG